MRLFIASLLLAMIPSIALAVYAKYTPTAAEVTSPTSSPASFTVPQPSLPAPAGFSVE